jgi:hypothetical protein
LRLIAAGCQPVDHRWPDEGLTEQQFDLGVVVLYLRATEEAESLAGEGGARPGELEVRLVQHRHANDPKRLVPGIRALSHVIDGWIDDGHPGPVESSRPSSPR